VTAVLGIETATRLCSIGLAAPGGPARELNVEVGNAHAERLPECVRTILDGAGLSTDGLGGVAVSIGPGSYTGLRIGLAFAKGLCFAAGKPIVAVPTLDAWLRLAPPAHPAACGLMHSRKGEVFRAVYRRNGARWTRVGGFETVPAADIVAGLPSGPVLFIGDGADLHRAEIERLRPDSLFPEGGSPPPSGAAVAELGREMLEAGETADADALSPMYLNTFQGML
jgi:tRNA threonylcarbamoyladenosine biosynthesis protein TsaB